MKKITNEIVSKALGWFQKAGKTIRGKATLYWTFPNAGRGRCQRTPPEYTTDLIAIVNAITGLDLHWSVSGPQGPKREYMAQVNGEPYHIAKTAPLALCHALLSHLASLKVKVGGE